MLRKRWQFDSPPVPYRAGPERGRYDTAPGGFGQPARPRETLAFVMQGLGTYAISLAAPDHVRDFWLSRATTGRAIAAFALTEPDAGSDVAAISTSASPEG